MKAADFMALAEPGGQPADAEALHHRLIEAGLPVTEAMVQSVGRDMGFAPQWVDDLGRVVGSALAGQAPAAPAPKPRAKRKAKAK
jgi:hypothetical protein